MVRFIIGRILWTIPVLLLVILMTFLMMRHIQGNPFRHSERAISPDKADAKPPNKNEAAVVAKAEERAPTAAPDTKAKAAERFWLQAGSFANEADAEDLKARLAFAGWEASIQLATLPDKSARYRVRLGPYDNTDALQRMKSNLAARGFDVAVIKF